MKTRLTIAILAAMAVAASALGQTVQTVVSGGMSEPFGIAIDSSTTDNYFYITDSIGGRVVRFAPATSQLEDFTFREFISPQGIVLARGGLAVADYGGHQVKFVNASGTVTGMVGTGARGLVEGAGATAQFDFPAGLAIDTAGNIYVADSKNNRIRLIAADNSVRTFGPASTYLGPEGVVVDGSGRVFVADTRNHVIRMISADESAVQVIAGREGVPGAESGPGLSSRFNLPKGLLWIGGETGLLVADTQNQTVRRIFERNGSWFVADYAGISGVHGNDDGAAATATFFEPTGLAKDINGLILVVDLKNDAVRRIARPPVTTPTFDFSGGSFSNAVAIKIINDAGITPTNSVFLYTLDGSDPVSGSPVFPRNASVTIAPVDDPAASTNVVLKVLGVSPDAMTGTIVSNSFNFFVAPITINIAGGSFTNDVSLVVTNLTAGSATRYTTDGSVPTTSSDVWSDRPWGRTGPLVLRAFRNGFASSLVSSNDFTFNVVAPTIDVPTGTFSNNILVKVTGGGTVGAVQYYTVNGNQPTTNDFEVVGNQISITTNALTRVSGVNETILTVAGFKPGYTNSPPVSATYTLTCANPGGATVPGGSFINTTNVVVTNLTANATIRFAMGAVPDANSPEWGTRQVSGNYAADWGQNGTLVLRAFKDGYNPSAHISWNFSFAVDPPGLTVDAGTFTNSISVTVTNETAGSRFYYTLDGTTPTPSTPTVVSTGGTITIDDNQNTAATNSILRLLPFKDDFATAPIVSRTYVLKVATPTASPGATNGVGSIPVTVESETDLAGFRYTLDGSTPTATSPLVINPADAKPQILLTTNSILRVVGLKGNYRASEIISNVYQVKVNAPLMSPSSGYFPDGTTVQLSVTNANWKIHYTKNGQDPTTNDTALAGPAGDVRLSQSELGQFKARAFGANMVPSDVALFQLVTSATNANTIGIMQDLRAGSGSSIVVPIVVNLQSNQVVRSIQYRVEVWPDTNALGPVLSSDLRVQGVTPLDFVPVVSGSGSSDAPVQFSYATYSTNVDGVAGRGLIITALGTNANLTIQDFATVALVVVPVPANAANDVRYKIQVKQPSATSDGLQDTVQLLALTNSLITVSDLVTYTVGDTSPGRWYNAGDFGNGDLDNADVNNAFYASLGVRVPFPYTDAFDAMDAYPDDTAASVGGDGQIRFLDWQRILFRSLRRETNNWARHWSTSGVRVATSTDLGLISPDEPTKPFASGLSASVLKPDAKLYGGTLSQMSPGATVRLPVRLQVAPGKSVSGLQFRAVVEPVDSAPPVSADVSFQAANGLPLPLQAAGVAANQTTAAWSELVNPPVSAWTGDNLVGQVAFTVPATAQAGDRYVVRFVNADGSPNLDTQYDIETVQGVAAVQAVAEAPVKSLPGVRLSWFGQAGQRYAVESTDNVASESWRTEAAAVVGQGREQDYIDQNPATQTKFYRVRLVQ